MSLDGERIVDSKVTSRDGEVGSNGCRENEGASESKQKGDGDGCDQELVSAALETPRSDSTETRRSSDIVDVEKQAGEDDETSTRRGKHTRAVQKSTKGLSRKKLLELIERKNDLLKAMKAAAGKAEQDIKNKEDRLLRMAAEFENYRKRTRREWELLQKNANAELIKGMLGVLDDFERALEAMGKADDQFQNGVRLIHSGLLDVLGRAGLAVVEAQGVYFNPQFHEAVGEVESADVQEGFVAHVVQKGYLLNDQLLRPARVIVAKKKD